MEREWKKEKEQAATIFDRLVLKRTKDSRFDHYFNYNSKTRVILMFHHSKCNLTMNLIVSSLFLLSKSDILNRFGAWNVSGVGRTTFLLKWPLLSSSELWYTHTSNCVLCCRKREPSRFKNDLKFNERKGKNPMSLYICSCFFLSQYALITLLVFTQWYTHTHNFMGLIFSLCGHVSWRYHPLFLPSLLSFHSAEESFLDPKDKK